MQTSICAERADRWEHTEYRHVKTLGGNCFYSNSRDSQSDSNVRKNSAANPNVGQQRHLVVQGQGETWSHSFGNLMHTLVAQQWITCFEICFCIQTVLWCSYQQLEYKLCNGSKRFETAGVRHTHGMNKLCIYNKFVAQRCKNIHAFIYYFLKVFIFSKISYKISHRARRGNTNSTFHFPVRVRRCRDGELLPPAGVEAQVSLKCLITT